MCKLRVDQEHIGTLPKIDLCKRLPRDPADRNANLTCVDSVIKQDGFPESVEDTIRMAVSNNRLVVGCRRGCHRSPVDAAAAKERLMLMGYSVGIIEYSLVQPDLVKALTMAAEEMISGINIVSTHRSACFDIRSFGVQLGRTTIET